MDIAKGTRRSWTPRLYPAWRDSALTGIPYRTSYVSVSGGWSEAAQKQEDEDRVFWSFQRFQRERRRAHDQRALGHRSMDDLILPTRLPAGTVTALLADGEFLWLGCDLECGPCVLLLHKPTFSWVGHLKVGAAPTSFAVSEEWLWIGLRGGSSRLLQVAKRTLTATPREQWRADEVSERELTSLLERRPVGEQALHAFLRGDYAQTVRLLERPGSSPDDVERLLLLACSHDDLGLGKPEVARRYFQEILHRQTNTAWIRVAREAARTDLVLRRSQTTSGSVTDGAISENRQSDPELVAQIDRILATHDKDGDGTLTAPEFKIICEATRMYLKMKPMGAAMPTPLLTLTPLVSERLPPLDLIFLAYDLDCDDGLNARELLALAEALRQE